MKKKGDVMSYIVLLFISICINYLYVIITWFKHAPDLLVSPDFVSCYVGINYQEVHEFLTLQYGFN